MRDPHKFALNNSVALSIRYSSVDTEIGLIDLGDLIDSYRGLRQTILASFELLYGEASAIRLVASTETKSASYEQVLAIIASTASTSPAQEALGFVIEIVKLLFGENGVIATLKSIGELRGTKSDPQLGFGDLKVIGDNNVINYSPVSYQLINDPEVRKGINNFIAPARSRHVNEIRVKSDSNSLVISPYSAKAIEQAGLVDQMEGFTREVDTLTVLKPSFEQDKRYRFRSDRFGDIGAIMEDLDFQRKVILRQKLFGTGDKLHVELFVRRYRHTTEYFVMKVLGEL